MIALLALVIQIAAKPSSLTEVNQVRLNTMADACHVSRTWLEFKGGEIIIRADPGADYDKIECILRKIRRAYPATNIGFLGNAQALEKH